VLVESEGGGGREGETREDTEGEGRWEERRVEREKSGKRKEGAMERTGGRRQEDSEFPHGPRVKRNPRFTCRSKEEYENTVREGGESALLFFLSFSNSRHQQKV
jgi:hypothetical protein